MSHLPKYIIMRNQTQVVLRSRESYRMVSPESNVAFELCNDIMHSSNGMLANKYLLAPVQRDFLHHTL